MANNIKRWNGTTWTPIVDGSTFATLSFGTVAVSASGGTASGGPVVADSTSDTMTLIAGTGVTLAADATGDTVTVSIGQSVATSASVSFAKVTIPVAGVSLELGSNLATGSYILFRESVTTVVADPTITTARSLGTKLILSPAFTAGTFADMAIGVGNNGGADAGSMWFGLPSSNFVGVPYAFRWYAAATELMALNAFTNKLEFHGNITLDGTSSAKISLTGATSNSIDWNGNGVALPTTTTRSAGTKLVLFSGLSSTNVDYAIGIGPSTLWYSVPSTAADHAWYVSTSQVMRYDGGLAALVLANDFYANGVVTSQSASTTNVLGLSYQSGVLSVARTAGAGFCWNSPVTPAATITAFQCNLAGVNQGGLQMTTAGVCSVAAFSGLHWSQLRDEDKVDGLPDILYGTVLETVDELCEWGDEHNEQLARCKVSDTPGSDAVYGVFIDYSAADEDGWVEDVNVMAVGAFVIRVSPDYEYHIGQYLESNGDGCARPQADNIMRASTIAKVTSTMHRHDYSDGSFVIPCTLHCG